MEIANNDRRLKIPEVALLFCIIKIAATTLGETGADWVTQSKNQGNVVGTAIFAPIFVVAVVSQILAKKFHPFLYWFAIIASTTLGTTLADYADRDLGIGYLGGTSLLFCLLAASLFAWHFAMGSISVASVSSPKFEIFYWVTIMFSQTLGTALGDWIADGEGGLNLGYGVSAILFGSLLILIAAGYFWTKISRTALFWAAFVLSRPLGAVLGDLLDKSTAKGGFNIDRGVPSIILLVFIVTCIIIFPQRAAKKAH